MSASDAPQPGGGAPDGLRKRLGALTPGQRAALVQALHTRDRDAAGPAAGEGRAAAPAPAAGTLRRRRRAASRMDFSLFFFSGDGSTADPGKYRLLLEAARYADQHGYTAISVPERHFVDFGGLYPNPSVLAAAIAAVTERIQIRSGSVVLPLHHPVRVAEEWSVVDNLSGGRVAISCASGWHPDDFLLAPDRSPERHQRRREELFDRLDTVCRLWAGETVEFPGATGEPVAVRTLPRPIQPRLPVWISSQGATDTFVRAGEVGANLLTGLVGQQPGELGGKISAYRAARRAAGHDPAAGRVTVMVHAFLGADDETVRRIVREPLISYLSTFLAQQDGIGEFSQISGEDRRIMLAAAFDRYFDSGALLGTPERCEALVEDLVDIDVDEIACLIDFGVGTDLVITALDHLTELQRRYRGEDHLP